MTISRTAVGQIILAVVVVALLGFLIASGIVEDTTNSPEVASTAAQEATTTTQTPTSSSQTPTTTAPEPAETDDFLTWAQSRTAEFDGIVDGIDDIIVAIETGNYAEAADVSSHIALTYMELWLEAPETGTELSDVGNRMLIECSEAYSLAAAGIIMSDAEQITEAMGLIEDCTTLMNETTALLPG